MLPNHHCPTLTDFKSASTALWLKYFYDEKEKLRNHKNIFQPINKEPHIFQQQFNSESF